MKNILLIKCKGIYGAIARYIDEFAAAFRELGYNTMTLDANLKGFDEKYQWLKSHYNIYGIVDCQAIALEALPDYGYNKDTAFVHYFVDHPLHHYVRFQKMNKNSIIFNVDRKHTEYIRKYYPEYMCAEFLPLSGSGADILLPYEERDIDLLFTGSYWVPKAPAKESANAGFAEMLRWKVQQQMLENPYISMEEVLEKFFVDYGIEVSGEEFKGILRELDGIELYVRAYHRDKMIRILLKSGIDVSVFGEGWENLQCEGIEHLRILKGGAEAARRALGHAKIVLNIMPGFKAGFQERIAAAMLSETVVVTDVSAYLEEEFCDGENLVFYHLDALEELPEKVKTLLTDTEKSRQIAVAGKRIAQERHTWNNRVMFMAEQIEKYHGNLYERSSVKGEEIVVPVEEVRASYIVQEVGVELSEELQLAYDLNRCGYLEEADIANLLRKLQEWDEKLSRSCQYHFLSENNLENVIAYFENEREKKASNSDIVQLLLSSLDRFLRGIKEKFESVGRDEILSGVPAGKNEELYDKILQTLFSKRYASCKEDALKPWKDDLEAGIMLQSYPKSLTDKYEGFRVDMRYDEAVDMLYVMHAGKRMYFPQEYTEVEVYIAYRFCCIEQDIESPHRYLNEHFNVPDDAIVIDAGVAEGNFALDVIERVKKIYLVECDQKWMPALKKTFEPYHDKVVFVPKMLGNRTDGDWITIDAIAGKEQIDFIKMDVEGAEAEALQGAEQTLARNQNMSCVVAAYHAKGMGDKVMKFLQDRGFLVEEGEGYIFYKDYKKPVWENELRHALIRAVRQNGNT